MQLLTIGVLSSCFISSCITTGGGATFTQRAIYTNETDFPITIELQVMASDSMSIRMYKLDSEATMEFEHVPYFGSCTIDNIEQPYSGMNCLPMYYDSLKITFNDSTFYRLTRADTVEVNILLRENYVITEQVDDQTDYKYTFTEKDYDYSTSQLE
jgi:hypothetical protein